MRLPFTDIPEFFLNYLREKKRAHPERRYELDFDILEPDHARQKYFHNYLFFRRTVRSLTDSPVLLLDTVATHFKKLNRCKTSCSSRLRHLDFARRHSFSVIRETYLNLNEKEEFPETEERRQNVISALDAVKNIMAGYKIVLREYSSLPDNQFYPLKNKIESIGFKIMELIYMEQNLGVLRYQKMSEHTWRECNQLFFYMNSLGLDQTFFSFPGNFQNESNNEKNSALPGESSSSIRELYVLVQLMGLMDIISWPQAVLKKMEFYVFETVGSVKLKSDNLKELQPGNLIIYEQQICPPFFSRLDTGDSSAILLDVSGFEMKLRDKYDQVVSKNSRKQNKGTMNISFEDYDEQGLLDKMLGKLYYFSRSETRNYVNKYSKLQLFFGFKNCFQFIRDSSNLDYELVNSGFSLNNALAGQTSLLVPEAENTERRWFVINESQGGIHLRLQETQYSPSMFIGQMVVVNVCEDEKNKFNIGYVSRIHRGHGNDVEITIIKIGAQAQCVGVQDELLKDKGDLVPSVLLKNYSGRDMLLMYSKQQLKLGSDLYLIWKNDTQTLELGQKNIKMPEFVGFEVKYYSKDISV